MEGRRRDGSDDDESVRRYSSRIDLPEKIYMMVQIVDVTGVKASESMISKGEKVMENDMLSLIKLMNEVLKLNGIMGDEDVKLPRKLQNCAANFPEVKERRYRKVKDWEVVATRIDGGWHEALMTTEDSRRSSIGDSDQITHGGVPSVWEIQSRKPQIPPKSSHRLRNLRGVSGRKSSFLGDLDSGFQIRKLKMFPGRMRRNF
ncbi:unnamed protein product [Linum tenue]|uniref:Uncharacterized protein n=1 Tax=Linum tenue TaxID=586396 RepID=A0AAV0RPJ0_9ROSI|nr:unnamed protein product [Linum tenue]